MEHPLHRWKKWLALGLSALLLTGCQGISPGGQNVEELLRAPQSDARQSAIQKALTSYLGETPQLKYPRGGDEMSPILLDDFDGDDVVEAMVLFTTKSDSQNVHLALLEPMADSWQVVVDTEGLSTEVAMAQRVSVLPEGVQLAVGYANANLADKYLAVYTYRDGVLNVAYQQAYDAYYSADFTGSGTTDLVVVPPPTQPGATVLYLVSLQNDALTTVQSVELDARFVACTGLSLTRYSGLYGLTVDGQLSSGGYASQVLMVSDGRFTDRLPAAPDDIVRDTTRDWAQLCSTDLSGTGVVLVPKVMTGVSTLRYAGRFYYVQWNNYLAEVPLAQFGVYDATYGYFMQLPYSWQNTVTITDGTARDEWQIRTKTDDVLLASVRVTDTDEQVSGYSEIVRSREKSVWLQVSAACTVTEARTLGNGIVSLAN